jgi:hypothetical protein
MSLVDPVVVEEPILAYAFGAISIRATGIARRAVLTEKVLKFPHQILLDVLLIGGLTTSTNI